MARPWSLTAQTPEVTVDQLAVELAGPHPPVLLDVREPEEIEETHIEGTVNIPMGQIVNRRFELQADSDIVVVCRTGNRSAQVTEYLLDVGFTQVRNLVGGIVAWNRRH